MPDFRHLRAQRATIGLRGMARIAVRNRLGRPVRAYDVCRPFVGEARGLEIGGPSAVFARNGILPLYPHLARLDNCDFAGETIWHGDTADGSPFTFDPEREPGMRYVRDATALEGIEDASYDLVLSSHTLEHVANPLRALAEWKRVLRDGGHLVLVLPHLENTFDHLRPVTTLRHLEDDAERSTSEDDDTHVREFIELCDLSRVPERLSREEFAQRTLDYVDNRTVHHHVFDTELVVHMLDRAGFQLVAVDTALPFHIVTVATVDGYVTDNGPFFSADADWRRRSVFRRDRVSRLASAPAPARRQWPAARRRRASNSGRRPRAGRRPARPAAAPAGLTSSRRASSGQSPGENSAAPEPCSTSGIAPDELATMGAPAAMASASTRPNCSSQVGIGRLASTTHDADANTEGISS